MEDAVRTVHPALQYNARCSKETPGSGEGEPESQEIQRGLSNLKPISLCGV